jgi:MFS family permease
MLGVGSLLAVPVTRWLGRLPVLFWCMILSFLMTVFSVTTADWIPFIVARLQGLFITTPQVVGLIIIHDMFFFHGNAQPTNRTEHENLTANSLIEHARKIGIWAATFIISPYAGPFLAGIVVTYRSWRVAQWVNAALLGFGLILVSLFGEETYWDPAKSDNHSANLSPNESWLIVRLKSLTGFSRSRAQDGDVLQSIYGLGFLFCRPHWLALCGTS